ncbi:ERF superfamily protein [Novosphingobium sp. PhB165]|uniref:ERF family protein n=1 Tax=Novosphingobium sp. PhB165 TaxID=2485105 RepID=UPI00104FEA32|nr:ERF family protein [Novosphingobium sp. PhB165]TCM21515.1 ERF superfamily protein [Novosphingobium sp. PhB165]
MNAVTPIEASASADVPAVYMAISNVMEQMAKEGIGKDRRNTQQGYNFRGIDDVYNALCGVLASNRLLMLPFVVDQKREERQTAKGGVLNYTILTVDFKLVSALDGSKDTVRMVGEAMDSADKSSNKAQSAAMKYAALQVFMIPTEGDNDADSTTHELAPREQGMPNTEFARLAQLQQASGISTARLCKEYGVSDLRQLNQDQYGNAVERLTNAIANKAKEETNRAAKAEQPAENRQANRTGQTGGDFTDIDESDVPF